MAVRRGLIVWPLSYRILAVRLWPNAARFQRGLELSSRASHGALLAPEGTSAPSGNGHSRGAKRRCCLETTGWLHTAGARIALKGVVQRAVSRRTANPITPAVASDTILGSACKISLFSFYQALPETTPCLLQVPCDHTDNSMPKIGGLSHPGSRQSRK